MITFLFSLAGLMIAALLWHFIDKKDKYSLWVLAITYLAASVMWLIDVIAEIIKEGFSNLFPSGKELGTECLLGGIVIAAGIILWGLFFVIKLIKTKIDAKPKKEKIYKRKF